MPHISVISKITQTIICKFDWKSVRIQIRQIPRIKIKFTIKDNTLVPHSKYNTSQYIFTSTFDDFLNKFTLQISSNISYNLTPISFCTEVAGITSIHRPGKVQYSVYDGDEKHTKKFWLTTRRGQDYDSMATDGDDPPECDTYVSYSQDQDVWNIACNLTYSQTSSPT